jgi:hypothetical protein
LIVAAISIGAIVDILYTYNGKSAPQWKITINTTIATFSTIAKATIMIVVASCLSQLKWIWLANGPRRLIDLQEFDDASRGALGSINILGKLKGGSVVMFLPN